MPKRPRTVPPSLYDSAITTSLSRDAALGEVAELVVALGRALHQVGQPAHKIEATLARVAERFRVPLETFIVPTGQFLSFHRADGPVTFVVRVKPGAINLDRLSRLMRVTEAVIGGSRTPGDARQQINRISEESNKRNPLAIVAAYALSAAPFSIFFGGGWTELIVATCVGLAVGLVAVWMNYLGRSGRVFELVAAAAAAFIAGSADEIFGAYGGWIPLAAGLIVLLPGIALVDSLEELSAGQLSAGSSRLAGVGVIFLALTFGALAGYKAAEIWPQIHDVEAVHLPEWVILPALLVVTLGSLLRFRVQPRDWWLVLGASVLAFVASRFGRAVLGLYAGAFLGAALLSIAGNIYARFSRRAAELITVPGIALLVPGAVGERSLESLLSQDTAHIGVADAFEMFMIAMALVAGFLLSNSILPDRNRA